MPEQIADVHSRSPHSLSATKILRLVSLLLVGLSFVVLHFFEVDQVGGSMQWKKGDTSISAGSHPAVILWAAAAIALFIIIDGQEIRCYQRGRSDT